MRGVSPYKWATNHRHIPPSFQLVFPQGTPLSSSSFLSLFSNCSLWQIPSPGEMRMRHLNSQLHLNTVITHGSLMLKVTGLSVTATTQKQPWRKRHGGVGGGRGSERHTPISPATQLSAVGFPSHHLKVNSSHMDFFPQYTKRQTLINNPLTAFIKCVLLLICIKQNQTKNQFLSVN